MIVVSDTTAISNLLQIGRDHLLPDLFGSVLIPPAVRDELQVCHTKLPKWLEVMEVAASHQKEAFRKRLHPGEAEALALALQVRPDWILLDDSDGRRAAKEEGLPVLGLMGVLLLAKKQGLLTEVKPLMLQLLQDAGFYLSHEVWAEVLRLAEES